MNLLVDREPIESDDIHICSGYRYVCDIQIEFKNIVEEQCVFEVFVKIYELRWTYNLMHEANTRSLSIYKQL